MKRVTGIVFLAAAASLLLGAGVVLGDSDEARERWSELRLDVAPVVNAEYADECGSCHYAYPPGLLPAVSWRRLMGELDAHFGENAELTPEVRDRLRAYLVEHAADRSNYKRSRGFASAAARGNAPLRITETIYFLRQHDEVRPWLVRVSTQPPVRLSSCDACHTRADAGSFDEHEIRIPGLGRWED